MLPILPRFFLLPFLQRKCGDFTEISLYATKSVNLQKIYKKNSYISRTFYAI